MTTINVVGQTSNTTASATISLSPSSDLPAGRLVVVLVAGVQNNNGWSSVADSQGNSYAAAAVRRQSNASTGIFYSVLATPLTTGDTITATAEGNIPAKAMTVVEVMDPLSPALDQTGTGGGATGAGTIVAATTAGATVNARDLAFGVAAHLGGTGGWTQPDGWTEDLDTTLSSRQISHAHKLLTTTGSVTYDPDNASTSAAWAASVATFGVTPTGFGSRAFGAGVFGMEAAGTGAFAVAGQAASLKVARKLTAAPGQITLAGKVATLRRGYRLAAAVGGAALAGKTAALRVGRRVAAARGTLAVTGRVAGLRRAISLRAEAAAFTVSGKDAELIAPSGDDPATSPLGSGGSNAKRWRGSTRRPLSFAQAEAQRQRQLEEERRRPPAAAIVAPTRTERPLVTLPDELGPMLAEAARRAWQQRQATVAAAERARAAGAERIRRAEEEARAEALARDEEEAMLIVIALAEAA